MNIKINDRISIGSDKTCFILTIDNEQNFYKTMDRLLLRVMNEEMLHSEATSIDSLKKKLDDLYTLIYAIYGISGMYPDIKTKQSKYSGVYHGKEN